MAKQKPETEVDDLDEAAYNDAREAASKILQAAISACNSLGFRVEAEGPSIKSVDKAGKSTTTTSLLLVANSGF